MRLDASEIIEYSRNADDGRERLRLNDRFSQIWRTSCPGRRGERRGIPGEDFDLPRGSRRRERLRPLGIGDVPRGRSDNKRARWSEQLESRRCDRLRGRAGEYVQRKNSHYKSETQPWLSQLREDVHRVDAWKTGSRNFNQDKISG